MAKIAITGATGFIGQQLVPRFLSQGHHVKALARRPQPKGSRVQWVIGDLTREQSLHSLVEDTDVVVHLAGATAGLTRHDFFQINAAGTTLLVDALESQTQPPRLIHISSLAAKQPTLSDYAQSKHAAEEIVASANLDWVILRPPAVYGPTDTELRPLWWLLKKGYLPMLSGPTARFSLVHVADLADAILSVATLPEPAVATHQIFELDDGYSHNGQPGYDWHAIQTIAQAQFGHQIRPFHIPYWCQMLAATLTDTYASLRRVPSVFSIGKVRELGYDDWTTAPSKHLNPSLWSPQRQLHDTLTTLV